MEEKKLVEDCLNGNELACKALFDLFASPMLVLCKRYINNTGEAEDALQDGFIKVFQNLQSWKGEAALGAWVRRIMVNTCLSRIKTWQYQNIEVNDESVPEISLEPSAISEISYQEIETLINDLPMGYKTVFNLCVIEGYSYPEIAVLLNVKESTCRSQLFKAKNYLAKKIIQLNPSLKYSL
ncbi:MAG: RNA polymerase sigma factor [Saprospiraceae bacterium]